MNYKNLIQWILSIESPIKAFYAIGLVILGYIGQLFLKKIDNRNTRNKIANLSNQILLLKEKNHELAEDNNQLKQYCQKNKKILEIAQKNNENFKKTITKLESENKLIQKKLRRAVIAVNASKKSSVQMLQANKILRFYERRESATLNDAKNARQFIAILLGMNQGGQREYIEGMRFSLDQIIFRLSKNVQELD